MIYLDHAATTPVRRSALEAMWPYLTGEFGNPSSTHGLGKAAADGLSRARAAVAKVLGGRASEVTFTAGGTEADNLALKGFALGRPRGKHLVTTPIEHDAVLASAEYLQHVHGFEVDYLTPSVEGLIDPEELAEVLREDTTLVSIHYANNEIGAIQPIAELTAVAKQKKVPFHTDAVQAAGHLPLNVAELGVDALSLSGHKVGAPKGSGVLWSRGRYALEPVIHGGGQERGRRSGTENIAGAVALAVALSEAEAERVETAVRLSTLRDEFIDAVLSECPGAQVTGPRQSRLPGHASFVFPRINGETVLLELESRGIVCSSGAACAAGADEPSHVLTALGMGEELARTAVRFTFGPDVTGAEIAAAAQAVRESVAAVGALGGR